MTEPFTRVTVTSGVFRSIENGGDYGASVTIKASVPYLVWAETGDVWISDADTESADPTEGIIGALMPTDLDGWLVNGRPVDVSGGLQTHTYDVTIQPNKTVSGKSVDVGSPIVYEAVAIPSSSGTFDLDTAASVIGGTGVPVSIPDYVAELEAAASAPTATAVAGWLSDPSNPVAEAFDTAMEARIIHVKHFGAVGNGTTDDTAAIQAAFDYMRTYTVTDPPEARPIVVSGLGGNYKVTSSLNLTGLTVGRNWGLRDLQILGACAGKTVLDLSASRFGVFQNVHIWGDQTNQPKTGLLLSKDNGSGVCSDHTFSSVTVDGYFTSAALHLNAAEMNTFIACPFWNRRTADGSGDAYAAIFDGSGYKVPTSDYITPNATTSSFTMNTFVHCSFLKPFGVSGPSVFMQDLASFTWDHCYLTNGSGSGILWRLTSNMTPYRVYLDFQQETTGTDRAIQFTSDAAAARQVIDLRMTLGNCFCKSELIAHDTLTALTLSGFTLRFGHHASAVTMTNGIFNTPGVVTINDGDILVPLWSDFPAPSAFAGISARVASVDGRDEKYGVSDAFTTALALAIPGTSTWTYTAKTTRWAHIGGGAVAVTYRVGATLSKGTGSGQLSLTLPTASAAGYVQSIAIGEFTGFTMPANTYSLALEITAATSTAVLRAIGPNASVLLTDAHVADGATVFLTFSGIYFES